MWSTWGASPWEGESGAEVGIVNREVAHRVRAGQTFPLFCWYLSKPGGGGSSRVLCVVWCVVVCMSSTVRGRWCVVLGCWACGVRLGLRCRVGGVSLSRLGGPGHGVLAALAVACVACGVPLGLLLLYGLLPPLVEQLLAVVLPTMCASHWWCPLRP